MNKNKKNSGMIVAKNTFFNALSGISVQALSLITGVFIARTFGPNGYGELSFSLVLVGYLMMGTDFGITAIAIRKIAQDKQNSGNYITTYLAARGTLSVIAYAVLMLIVFFSDFTKTLNLLIMAYGLMIFSNICSVYWVFNAHQKMEYQSLCEIVEKLLYVLFIFVGYYCFRSMLIVPFSQVISLLIASVLGWIILKKKFVKFNFVFDKVFFKELFIYSWPVGLSNGASRINTNLDTIFIQLYHGSVLTGEYNAAYKLVGLIIIFGNFFTTALYPLICEKASKSDEEISKVLATSTTILIYAVIPVVVIMIMLSSKLIILLFGVEYVNGHIALKILASSSLFLLISRLFGNTLLAINRQNLFMVIMLVSAMLNAAMNYLFIPQFGILGAACSTLITELMILSVSYYFIKKRYPIHVGKPFLQSIIAGVVMVLYLWLFKEWHIILLLMTVPFFYIGALYLLGVIQYQDVAVIMKKIKQKYS